VAESLVQTVIQLHNRYQQLPEFTSFHVLRKNSVDKLEAVDIKYESQHKAIDRGSS
jgi:hypothetical protein